MHSLQKFQSTCLAAAVTAGAGLELALYFNLAAPVFGPNAFSIEKPPVVDFIKSREPAPGRPLRIGYVGSVIPSKGVHLLLEAVRALGDPSRYVVEVHGAVLPFHNDRSYGERLAAALASDRAFVWVKRKLDPPQVERVRGADPEPMVNIAPVVAGRAGRSPRCRPRAASRWRWKWAPGTTSSPPATGAST